MSIVELRADVPAWPVAPTTSETTWQAAWPHHSRLERMLPALTGATLFVLDIALVVGAFMLA